MPLDASCRGGVPATVVVVSSSVTEAVSRDDCPLAGEATTSRSLIISGSSSIYQHLMISTYDAHTVK